MHVGLCRSRADMAPSGRARKNESIIVTAPFAPPRVASRPMTSDRLRRVRVVLVAPSHPGNIGAAARAMLTMGVGRLVLVAPRRFPDPRSRRARVQRDSDSRRRASGRDARRRHLPVACWPSDFRRGRASSPAGCCRCALRPSRRSATLHTVMSRWCSAPRCRACRTTSSRAAASVATIPANPDYASLNLAAAVQVVAYELRVAAAGGDVWRAPRFEPATADEIEALVRPRRADAGRDALPRSADAANACCRGCGDCSRARVSKRRKSTSCAASSPGSISS